MAITLRQESDARASTKGTSLNFQELDNNFIDLLNRAALAIDSDSGSIEINGDGTNSPRLVVNGAGGLTTAITQDSTGQAVLTLTQSASGGGITDINPGGNITVSQDSAGGATISVDTTITSVELKNYTETFYDLGSSDTPTIDLTNGNVQKLTISSGLTLPTIDNMPVGGTITLVVTGSGTASDGSDSAGQSYIFAGGNTTLTSYSIISIFYDGSTYWTSIATDFQ